MLRLEKKLILRFSRFYNIDIFMVDFSVTSHDHQNQTLDETSVLSLAQLDSLFQSNS